MATNILTKLSQTQISGRQAVIAGVVTALAVVAIGYWVLGGPSRRVPSFEQVKAQQAAILKNRASLSAEIHADAIIHAGGKPHPQAQTQPQH